MNFVIFPMFIISPVPYPLRKLEESGTAAVHFLATWNPYTHAVEAIRFALYGQLVPSQWPSSRYVWRCSSRWRCKATIRSGGC